MKQLLISFIFVLGMASGCATAPHVSTAPSDLLVSRAHETSFEITYSLGGHGEHRLVGGTMAPSTQAHVARYLDREIIDQASINASSYNKFLENALHFTEKPQRLPAREHDCRAPYWINLKIDQKSYSYKGCRENDGGDFAKLVREGEFLLYSKK